jgi:hypothetical protein
MVAIVTDANATFLFSLAYGRVFSRCIDGHVNGRFGRCVMLRKLSSRMTHNIFFRYFSKVMRRVKLISSCRCPTCFKGKLNLKDEDAGATVICKGYYDEDMARHIPCGWAVQAASAPRLRPWYINEPTESQIEAMKAATEEHEALADGKGGGSSSGGGAAVPAELLSAAEDLDEDRWEDADTKAKAQFIVDIGTSGKTRLDFPQDEKKARIAVGKMILSNPEASAVEMLKLAMAEFGVATAKEEAKARQKSAMENSCAVPANAGIVQVFQELGDYYFKEGNPNAGLTVGVGVDVFVFFLYMFLTITFIFSLVAP